MARHQDTDLRDLEQELADSIRRRQNDEGDSLAGLFTLTRTMETEEEDQFDVDMTILDFLAYRATESIFEWQSKPHPYESDLPDALVTMTAEWRTVLKHRYEGRHLSSHVAFRSRLLQFALLFTHRLKHDQTWTKEHSLNEIRAQNKNRGLFWQRNTSLSPALRDPFDSHSEFPLSDGALAENRSELASKLGMPRDRRRWVTDLDGTPSLHCLLPLFIELTAARTELEDEWLPTGNWFHLAGQFMLQAALEEYLRNGAYGSETFNTIFAFGCPGIVEREEEVGETMTRAMRSVFCNQDNPHEQVHGWAKTRRQYISELLPQSANVSSLEAMESAQDRFPYTAFEAQVIAFLSSLHEGWVKPDLVQVEQGRITIHGNDLPEDESREMIRRMRLDS